MVASPMRALISVSDKRGVVEIAKTLHELGAQILSTGGTASALAGAGIPVTQVASYTGAPEILDGRGQAPVRRDLPATLGFQWRRLYELRYGENPHQKAAFYSDAASPLAAAAPGRPTIAAADVLGGKQLSYNNILDLDAALGLCL